MKYKAALITGAADRLGRAMALDLAARGTDVVVHYASSKSKAQDVAREAQALGVKAVAIQADLTDREQTDGLVTRAVDAVGQLDVLINNASVFEYDNIETATHDGWDRHISSNFHAPFILTQSFAAQCPETGSDGEPMAQAAIINMVDQRVRNYTPEFMTYSLAKNALWTLTQTGAQALAPRVRVNAIGPGPTLQGARQSLEHFQGQRRNTILERGANVDDILGAMRFFLDAPAVTGQLICVDGGQHLGWKTADVRGIEEG
jgi:NAD(P)-dependent dehydrogenase (short-subunit alcohol dehydrogenase family)